MGGIPVIWQSYNADAPSRGYWDMGMLEDIFANRMWKTGYKFAHYDNIKDFWDSRGPLRPGAVVVLPARNQVQYLDQLNQDIKDLPWCILMLTGDEEAVFPVEKVIHPNIRIWVMSPRPGRHKRYSVLGTGYPPQMHALMPSEAPTKDLDLFFAGQITHPRREKMAAVMTEIKNNSEITGLKVDYHFSKGFTQGLPPLEYYDRLSRAKVATAPSGPETPDSFRLFEALEAFTVPIADTRVQKGDFPDDYWTYFFGQEPPFPVTTDWDWLQGWTQDQLALYPVKNNRIGQWWLNKKREMALKVAGQIGELSGIPKRNTRDDQITILMSSNAINTHPETKLIEQCVRDVRVQLPESEIIIMLDGIRPEREDRRADYEEYQRRLLWLCNYQWTNVRTVRFEEFGHQSTMTREVLKEVTTPFVLFVEHDTPLVPDYPIEWDGLCKAIENGEANVIRLHHEAGIHPEHQHLMLSGVQMVEGVPMMRTAQWSQRPHLASTAFYRFIIDTYFKESSKAFIEHGVYGPCVEAFNREGVLGWNLWKLWIYAPKGEHIKRSYDLNGRGDGTNFESIF